MITYQQHGLTWNRSTICDLADDCYPNVSLNIETTHAQRTALFRKWKQDHCGSTWHEFAHSAQPTFACDNAIVVKWCGMYLCIETDGYTHS